MINWRRGKAGFVGASKRLIKGFFDFRFSLSTAIILPSPPIAVPIDSLIDPNGLSLNSGMTSDGVIITSLIAGTLIEGTSIIGNEVLTLHTGL